MDLYFWKNGFCYTGTVKELRLLLESAPKELTVADFVKLNLQ